MRRATVLVLLAATAFGVTSCGGKSSRPSGPVDASFAAMLDGEFRADWQQLSSRGSFPFPTFDITAPDPKLLPKVGAFLAANAPVRADIEARLRRVAAPANGKQTWTQLKVYAIEANTLALRQIQTAKSGNVRGFTATVQLLGNLHDLLVTQLKAAGLPDSNSLSQILLA